MRLAFVVLALSLMGCAKAVTPVNGPAGGDPRSIAVRDSKHGFVFVRGDGTELTEADFRAVYRAEVGPDLDDELAAETMHKKGVFAVGMGVATVAGGTALVALGDCKKAAVPSKCDEGKIDAALLAATGLYVLGCEAIKGPRCFADGDVVVNAIAPSHLDRQQASYYADRYNDAINGTELEGAPTPKKSEPKRASFTVTPSGVSGRF